MLYRSMPNGSDRLSILGFGAMRLPMKNGIIDEEKATKLLRYAIDQGINYVDTAWPYHGGESEPFLGRALADGYRDRVKLATKLPTWLIDSREDMDRYLNLQLEKMRTSHIDYYLLHTLNGDSWDKMRRLGAMEFLVQAKKDGRIVNHGFSFHGILEDFKRIVDDAEWDFCQIQYNYLDEEHQAGTEGLHYVAERGLGVIIMEPLRGGNLAIGKPPPEIAKLWNGAERRRTPAEWALRWLWNRPEIAVVLSGMNEMAQLRENLKVADQAFPNTLTDAETDLVRCVARKYREIMKIGCTGCDYCKPCPEGVNIPGCFDVYNELHMYGQEVSSKFTYVVRNSGILSGNPAYASLGVQCQECVEKCPQELPIPELLEDVAKELEGADLPEMEAKVKRFFNIR